MPRISKREAEYVDTLETYIKAVENAAIAAFNEGYLLGLKYGRNTLKGKKDEN